MSSPYITQPRKYMYKPPTLPTGALANISRIPGVSPPGAAPSIVQTISQRTQEYSRPQSQQQQVTPLDAYKDKLKARVANTTDYTTKIKGLKTKNAQRLNVQSNRSTQQARNTYTGSSGRTRGSWGGYSNGQIPVQALTSIGGGQYLRADAATAFSRLNAAFTQAFSRGISVTDSYRTLGSQRRLAVTKPGLAARPGTSNHGWGL